MRIAIPLTKGRLSEHFGHCEQFAIIDVDTQTREIKNQELLTPPPHQPGLLPQWLASLCVDLVIAGGIGQRAQHLFKQNNIDVLVGAPNNTAEQLAIQYLTGQLKCGPNICDH